MNRCPPGGSIAGDSAHVIAPLGGKGMNLALHDAFTPARALVAEIRDGNGTLLGRTPTRP